MQLEGDQHVATHIHEFALHAFPSPDGEKLPDEARESIPSQPSTRVDIKFEGPRLPEDLTQGQDFAYSVENIRQVVEELRLLVSDRITNGALKSLAKVAEKVDQLHIDPFFEQKEVDLEGLTKGLSEALALASQPFDIWLVSDDEEPQVKGLLIHLEEIMMELPSLFESGRRVRQLRTGPPTRPPASPLTTVPGERSPTSPGDPFYFPRPDDSSIEDMFLQLIQKRGWQKLPEQAQRQMAAYPSAKKWTPIYQDRLAEWQSQQKIRINSWQVIHKVECRTQPDEATYYLESPWVVQSGPFDAHLNGAPVISNLELFLQSNPEIQFIVYRDYICCDVPQTSTLQGQEESSSHMESSSFWRGERISIIAPELLIEFDRLSESALRGIPLPWNFKGQGDILYPYLWFFHRRGEIQDELNKRALPPNTQLRIDYFTQYILGRMEEEWALVDSLLGMGSISPEYMEYLIVSVPVFSQQLTRASYYMATGDLA